MPKRRAAGEEKLEPGFEVPWPASKAAGNDSQVMVAIHGTEQFEDSVELLGEWIAEGWRVAHTISFPSGDAILFLRPTTDT